MSVIFVVLPLALLIVLGAAWAFVWASRQGQFDDLETPALRMLHDDPPYGGLPRQGPLASSEARTPAPGPHQTPASTGARTP